MFILPTFAQTVHAALYTGNLAGRPIGGDASTSFRGLAYAKFNGVMVLFTGPLPWPERDGRLRSDGHRYRLLDRQPGRLAEGFDLHRALLGQLAICSEHCLLEQWIRRFHNRH